jgi:hypothetical protein
MVNRLLRTLGLQRAKSNNEISEKAQPRAKVDVVNVTTSASQQKQATSEEKVVVVDSIPNAGVQEDTLKINAGANSVATIKRLLPSSLPEDIAKLAAQNTAFFQGILALQRLNLDSDLFLEAVEDLKKKYYKERSAVIDSRL